MGESGKAKVWCSLISLAVIISTNLICYYSEYSSFEIFEISVSVSVCLVVGVLVSLRLQDRIKCLAILVSVAVIVLSGINAICYYYAEYSVFVLAVSASVGLVVGSTVGIYLVFVIVAMTCLPFAIVILLCLPFFFLGKWLKEKWSSRPRSRSSYLPRTDYSTWAPWQIREVPTWFRRSSYRSRSNRSKPVVASRSTIFSVESDSSHRSSAGRDPAFRNPVSSNSNKGSLDRSRLATETLSGIENRRGITDSVRRYPVLSNSSQDNPGRSNPVCKTHHEVVCPAGSDFVHKNPIQTHSTQDNLFPSNLATDPRRGINPFPSVVKPADVALPRAERQSRETEKDCLDRTATDSVAPDLTYLSKRVRLNLTRLLESNVVMSDYVLDKHFNTSGRTLDEDEAVRISEAREQEQGPKKTNTVFDMPSEGFNLYRTDKNWIVHISSEPVSTFQCRRDEGLNSSVWHAKPIGLRYAVFREGHCLVHNSLRSWPAGPPKQKRSGSTPSRSRRY